MDSNVLLLIWVLCGFFGAAVAEKRNRTLVEGALLGLLLGPIGVLIVLLWPGKKDEATSPSDQPSS